MRAENTTKRRTDLRLSGVLSVAFHLALLGALGVGLARSRAGATTSTPPLLCVNLEISAASPEMAKTAGNSSTAPSALPVPAPLPPTIPPATPPVPKPQPPPPSPALSPPPAPPEAPPVDDEPDELPTTPEWVAPKPVSMPSPSPARTPPPVQAAQPDPTTINGVSSHADANSTTRAKSTAGRFAVPQTTDADATTGGGPGIEGPVSFRRPIQPLYPLGARQRGEEGKVVVEAAVAPNGRTVSTSVLTSSRSSELDRAAVRAVERATFNPATENGRAVEAKARITIVFRLTN